MRSFRGSILDLAGLTDAHIARGRGVHGHKEWDEAYFRQRRPDLVLVVGSRNSSNARDSCQNSSTSCSNFTKSNCRSTG